MLNLLKYLPLIAWIGLTSVAWAQEGPNWHTLPDALDEAGRADRPVLVYVHAPWCGLCLKMEAHTFPAANVRTLLDRFVLAELDYDDEETLLSLSGQVQSAAAWARQLGAEATPSFVFLTPRGTPITRVSSYLDAPAFSLLLAYVATGAYRHASFAQYVDHTRQSP